MKSKIRAYTKALNGTSEEGMAVSEWLSSKNLTAIHYEMSNNKGKAQEVLGRLIIETKHRDILLISDVNHLVSIHNHAWLTLIDTLVEKQIILLIPSIELTHIALDQQRVDSNSSEILTPTRIILAVVKELRRKKDKHIASIADGVKRASEQGRFAGRKTNTQLYKRINEMLNNGSKYTEVIAKLGCSSATIAKAVKQK